MVHWDCKGQTGAAMTMGRGAILSYSWKQKLNTKSSTETELVGVDDAISNILWSLYFLQAQGCGTTHAIIYQDNKSAILLESNGKISSGKCTKHIKAKYFFVTDKVADGDVIVKHVPTNKMWADMNTKPKQGLPFRTDRSYMMNCDVDVNSSIVENSSDKKGTQNGTKIRAVEMKQAQQNEPPHTTEQAGIRTSRAGDAITPRVYWGGAQECVGSTRHLGGHNAWSRVTSVLRGGSKRLLR
eukprot:CCRYP_008414-RB/>CCRYP_008414-RB protein AED:0.57 eAED:0.57 QI:0/-1/0/1/-1/0/1/0/240